MWPGRHRYKRLPNRVLRTLAVSNYRSLRDLLVPLGPLVVITGANGSGKSSLYRCLTLLHDAAHGRLVRSLAQEGGLQSTLWAGPETISRAMRTGQVPIQGTVRTKPIHLRLGFSSDDFGYSLELGPPPRNTARAFDLDPEIKREVIWAGPSLNRHNALADRQRRLLLSADDEGRWTEVERDVPMFESLLTRIADPVRTPEVLVLRERIREWRFYDQLRADREAPSRRPQVGTWTPVMAADGSDLAAAIRTLQLTDHDRAYKAFSVVIDDAFPGSSVQIHEDMAFLRLQMTQPGMLRPLSAAELSEGTLRFLMLAAALLSAYPPDLLVLNEPESSLHVDLLPALGRLIRRAAERSQVMVVTHATSLADALLEHPEALHHVLVKDFGETQLEGQGLLDKPSWHWPARK
ncbi:MAG: AAA family ATPase [Myxococcota bacterium]